MSCICGLKGDQQILDANLFAETVSVNEFLEVGFADCSTEEKTLRALNKAKGNFVEFVRASFANKVPQKCVKNGSVILKSNHELSTKNLLLGNPPEVLVLNLSWPPDVAPTKVLKLLLTIPEKFPISDLYDLPKKTGGIDSKFVFRGMICFSGNNSLAMFRRMHIKYDFLGCD